MRKKINNLLLFYDIDKFGIGNVSGLVPDEFSHLKTAISFAVHLSDSVIDEIVSKPTHTYFHHYRTVNSFIDFISLRLVLMLQKYGYNAVAVPASQSVNVKGKYYEGIFQHRTAATISGVGWIGKNNCLITEEYGPRIRLGTVLTDLILDYDTPITKSRCGSCEICVRKCPPMALTGELWDVDKERFDIIDPRVCSKHMSMNYKDIGRGSVCGLCIRYCPRGTKINRKRKYDLSVLEEEWNI